MKLVRPDPNDCAREAQIGAIEALGSDLERAQASITWVTSFKLAKTGISRVILKICKGISRDILSNTELSRVRDIPGYPILGFPELHIPG